MSTSPNILVVDDEESIRMFAARALTEASYQVAMAHSGAEALQLDAQQGPFDLFVVDLMMPNMSGDELARELRLLRPDVKVLYLTGYSDRLFVDRNALLEHEAFVEKPTTMRGLLEAVSLMLFGHTRGPAATPFP